MVQLFVLFLGQAEVGTNNATGILDILYASAIDKISET